MATATNIELSLYRSGLLRARIKIHPANAERSHGIFCNSPIVAIW